MPAIDLVYDQNCPNVAAARAKLMRAFARAGVHAHWKEWDSADPRAPLRVKGYGSPTVLVDGKDVAGALPVEGMSSCRLYAHEGTGLDGVPSAAQIADALVRSATQADSPTTPLRKGWKNGLAMVPAVGVSLLPKIACPACWPAYAGLLSSVGLGFLINTRWMFPLTAVFLAVAVGALAFRARRRRGYGPFAVGVIAAVVVLVGKFEFENNLAMYIGLGTLVAASMWNNWPTRASAVCPVCTSQQSTP